MARIAVVLFCQVAAAGRRCTARRAGAAAAARPCEIGGGARSCGCLVCPARAHLDCEWTASAPASWSEAGYSGDVAAMGRRSPPWLGTPAWLRPGSPPRASVAPPRSCQSRRRQGLPAFRRAECDGSRNHCRRRCRRHHRHRCRGPELGHRRRRPKLKLGRSRRTGDATSQHSGCARRPAPGSQSASLARTTDARP